MSIQEILEQLSQQWYGGSMPALAYNNPLKWLAGENPGGLTSQNIMTQAGQAAGFEPDEISQFLDPGMFQPLSKGLLKSSSIGAYSPIFEQQQGSLSSKLMESLGGKKTKQAFGGFAGSGQAGRAVSGIRDVYGKGMQDTLTQALGGKAQSLASIQEAINQWARTAESFRGTQS